MSDIQERVAEVLAEEGNHMKRMRRLSPDARNRSGDVAIDLFREKFEGGAGCWEWRACKDSKGYGAFTFAGSQYRAHRVSYEFFIGPIADGLVIDHLCRNTSCVNPAHLEPVTNRENVLRGRGVSAGNMAKTRCIRGHEFSSENTRLFEELGRMRRVCRTCHREAVARAKRRKQGTSNPYREENKS